MNNGYRIAVVGATGQVGTLMLRLLAERSFPAREIVPFASERSAGRVLKSTPNGSGHAGEPWELGPVRTLSAETIQGVDIALFSAGASASRRAPRPPRGVRGAPW